MKVNRLPTASSARTRRARQHLDVCARAYALAPMRGVARVIAPRSGVAGARSAGPWTRNGL